MDNLESEGENGLMWMKLLELCMPLEGVD